MANDAQLISIFQDIQKNIANLASRGAMGPQGSSRSGSRALDEADQENYERELRLTARNLTAHNKAVLQSIEALKNLTALQSKSFSNEKDRDAAIKNASTILAKSFKQTAKVQDQLATEYNRLASNTLPEQILAFKNLVKGANTLSNNLSNAQRQTGLLSAALIKRAKEVDSDSSSLNYARYIKDLSVQARKLPETMLKSSGIMDEYTDELGKLVSEFKDNVTAEDFAALRSQIGEAQVSIREAFSGIDKLGFGNFDDIMKSGFSNILQEASKTVEGTKKIEDALIATALKLQKDGIKFPDNLTVRIDKSEDGTSSINAADITKLHKNIGQLANELQDFYTKTQEGADGLDKLAVEVNSAAGGLKRNFLSISGVSEIFSKKLGELVTTGGSLAAFERAIRAITNAVNEAATFNASQTPQGYLTTQAQSVHLGMSFADTANFLNSNRRSLSQFGASGFGNVSTAMMNQMQQFGFTRAQSAGAIAPIIGNAASAGINVQSAQDLSNFTNTFMKSFNRMNTMVSISAEEYAKLNQDLLDNSSVMQNMTGLSSKQAVLYSAQLVQQREALVTGGLTLQQAQEVVKAREEAKRANINNRLSAGGAVAMQMMQLGFSSDKVAAAMRASIGGRAASSEDQAVLQDALQQIGPQREARLNALAANARQTGNQGGFLGLEAFFNKTNENLGIYQSLVDAGLTTAQQQRANNTLTNGQKTAAAIAGQGSATAAGIGNAINSASTLINNSFLSAIGKSSMALLSLVVSAGAASLSLSSMVGLGLGGKGIGGLFKGLGGAAIGALGGGGLARLAGGALRMGGTGLLGLGVGALGNFGGGALAAAGHPQLGAISSILGSTAGGALAGSMFGLPGALVGGALGLGKSLFFDGQLGNLLGVGLDGSPITSLDASQIASPVNSNSGINSPILGVTDESANRHLSAISQYLMQTVTILSDIAKNGNLAALTASPAAPQIQTSSAYIAGRQ